MFAMAANSTGSPVTAGFFIAGEFICGGAH
jgi:hypothetical protein